MRHSFCRPIVILIHVLAVLSPVHTVAEKWDYRRKRRLSPNSATVAVFCDSLTFLRQCGQGFRTSRHDKAHSFIIIIVIISLALIMAVIFERVVFLCTLSSCPALTRTTCNTWRTSSLITSTSLDTSTTSTSEDRNRFLQRVSIACISYDRFCLTLCHTLLSCQNDSSYDHAVFTGG